LDGHAGRAAGRFAIHGVGIKPSVLVHPTLAGIRAGRDEVLEKGIAVAEGKDQVSPTP